MTVTKAIMASRRRQDRIGALQDAERYVASAHIDLLEISRLLRAEAVKDDGPEDVKGALDRLNRESAMDEAWAVCRRKLDIAEARIREVRDAG